MPKVKVLEVELEVQMSKVVVAEVEEVCLSLLSQFQNWVLKNAAMICRVIVAVVVAAVFPVLYLVCCYSMTKAIALGNLLVFEDTLMNFHSISKLVKKMKSF